MSDFLPDTPSQARQYCPECEIETDPTKEILEVRHCGRHSRDDVRAGLEDAAALSATTGQASSGAAESGGDNNRQWCNFIHGRLVTKVADDNKPAEG